jgi:hypothetical protein
MNRKDKRELDELEEALESMSDSDFNRLRFNVLTKSRSEMTQDKKEILDAFLSEIVAKENL